MERPVGGGPDSVLLSGDSSIETDRLAFVAQSWEGIPNAVMVICGTLVMFCSLMGSFFSLDVERKRGYGMLFVF